MVYCENYWSAGLSRMRRSSLLLPGACSVGALPKAEYWKIGFYFGLLVVVYLLFSLPMSYIRHSRVDYTNAEELKLVPPVGACGVLKLSAGCWCWLRPLPGSSRLL